MARRLSEQGGPADLTVNIGRGEGVSVRELADLVGEITGHRIKPEAEPRRAGDAARAVASATRMSEELGWTARRGCGRWSSRPGRAGVCATPRRSAHDPRMIAQPL